ncbi:hypothetical protein ABE29_18800 [Cytobacillus firmus]|uniref:hypothetical protein n=1 Tax=Cytobacillus firmus TaxID=1399 RepID=UPI00077CB3EF|nr:hypothetical protein [Cytobacillus firmus]MBG9544732.1 hypothetical protein [Cytobacillus firmus]MBG9553989.1 hypothetical protein [Cytobacillus firmus]MBG9558479.1 hypothetical protein [Cytobacillus firmus]MBG9576978.1 hypothetical protein [Cytobacillus firmus]MEC1894370.1 flagellar protein FliT [Cytobacillus firmus]
MSAVEEFYRHTQELISLLENDNEFGRDEKIIEMNRLIAKREALILHIKPPFSKVDEELGVKAVKLNEQLMILLNNEKGQIQKAIKELRNKKDSSNKYVNPYEEIMTDGIFYDQRK